MQCLYKVPCCGGFCAPTPNPDESCARHVSNEWLVPGGPDGFINCVKNGCEASCFCRACGRLGIPALDKYRKPVTSCGVLINVTAVVLYIVALCGATADPIGLKNVHWTYGEWTDDISPFEMHIGPSVFTGFRDCSKSADVAACNSLMTMLIGTQAEYEADGDNKWRFTKNWKDEDACAKTDESAIRSRSDISDAEKNELVDSAEANAGYCAECQKNLLTISTLIMSIVSCWPSILTDMQRSTQYGDINCQAFGGVASNLFGFLTSIGAVLGYSQGCYSALPTTVQVTSDGKPLLIEIEWRLGPGYICLLLATICKLFDALMHAMLPTPKPRHSPLPKGWTDGKTTIDYLMLGVESAPKQQGMEGNVDENRK